MRIDQAQAHARCCSADGARHRLGIIREAREGVKAGLEHAIEFDQVPGHPGPEGAQGFDRTGGPARNHDPERTEIKAPELRIIEHGDERGGSARDERDALAVIDEGLPGQDGLRPAGARSGRRSQHPSGPRVCNAPRGLGVRRVWKAGMMTSASMRRRRGHDSNRPYPYSRGRLTQAASVRLSCSEALGRRHPVSACGDSGSVCPPSTTSV